MVGTVDQTGLTSQHLATVPLRVVGPQGWSRELESASLEQLTDFPWVDGSVGGALAYHRRELFAATGSQPACPFTADTDRAIAGIVTEGLALGLLREDLALAGEQAGDLCLWPGEVPDLLLRFVLPMIRRDEDIGRALADAVDRSWSSESSHARTRRAPGGEPDQGVSATLSTGASP